MKHVRILGLCLLAVFALGASASSSALASGCRPPQKEYLVPEGGYTVCETEKEHTNWTVAFAELPSV